MFTNHNVEEEARSALPAFVAFNDVSNNNKRMKETYSNELIQFGEELKELAQDVCFRNRVYLNFRQKFMTVKIEAVNKLTKLDREFDELMDLVSVYDLRVKNGRGSSLIIEIPKDYAF